MTSLTPPRPGSKRLQFFDRYPLRVTIVVVVLALAAVALVVSGLTATTIMRGYMLDRADQQLSLGAARIIDRPAHLDDPGRQDKGPPLPSEFVVQILLSDGRSAVGNGPISAPLDENAQPPALPHLTLAQVRALDAKPFTIESNGSNWRVLALPLDLDRDRQDDGSILIAQSLGDLDQTIDQLIGVQIAIGVILLVLLAGVGTYVVRRSLRGLEDVEQTAVAIAHGDLGRRVPQRDPRTEVGQLSLALNAMLGQIETAFAQRTASEYAARQSEELARRSEEAARHSEDQARQSEERMRRFIADASHELRTPLTSIRGFAELVRQGGGTADPATMRRIEQEAKRMGLLVDDLLLLARLDQQRPLSREPVDLLGVAGDAVHAARAIQPEREVTLNLLPDSEAPVVEGDEARLRQVVGNLVSNALHHTPLEAPVTVSVGTRDGQAVLEVADRGPGLSDEQKAKVFERFYRADSARTRATGGSGLGLSIVAALVAAHNGTVRLSDTPGGGATFTVTLPLVDQSR